MYIHWVPGWCKGFKVWNLESTGIRCFYTRDVTFDETKMGYILRQEAEGKSQHGNDGSQFEVELLGKDSEIEQQDHPEVDQESDDTEGENPPENDTSDYRLAQDRQRRTIKPPLRFGHADLIHYALSIAEDVEFQEPSNYKEAITCKDNKKWIKAMHEEIDSLAKNQTWVLVNKPKNQRIVGCKWIYKLKECVPGVEKLRYKARLVAKGFTQREG